MPIYRRAEDGSLHSFPDGASWIMIEMEMREYNGRQGDLRSLAALPFDLVRGVAMGPPIQDKWARIADAQGRHGETVDNDIDAQRHAEWHQKMAQRFGPRNAVRVGDLREDLNRILAPLGVPYTPAAERMDRYNNRTGARSVVTGRRPSLDDLQLSPDQRARNHDSGLGSYNPYARTRRDR